MPKISVVMPVYNAEKYLREAIDSILNQTYGDFEFIIIDDGSTDSSPEIVRSYSDPRIRFYINEHNMGVAETLNLGLELASGEYIARMDSDDISLPERFEKQVAFMDAHTKVAVCATAVHLFGAVEVDRVFSTTPNELKVDLLFGNCFAHPTVMLRGSVIKNEKYYYNKNFDKMEDYEMWVRISRKYALASLRDVLLKYRVHSMQVTQNYGQEYEVQIRVLKEQMLTELGLNQEKYLPGFLLMGQKDLNISQSDVCLELLSAIVVANNGKNIYEPKALRNSIVSIVKRILAAYPRSLAFKSIQKFGLNPFLYTAERMVHGLKSKVSNKVKVARLQVRLKNKNFTIISNNCWGSFIYQKYGLPYQSPTAGLFFLGHDFVKLCSDWKTYFSMKLVFIPWESCTYYDELKEQKAYPVAKLGDIEVYFMHYKTEAEAAEKWYRRIERINPDQMLFKLSQREGCSKEDVERFMKLPLKNKLCFAYDDVPGTIHVPELNGFVGDEFPVVQRYTDDLKILNSL